MRDYLALQELVINVAQSIRGNKTKGRELRSTAWLDGLRGIAALEVLIFHYADFWVQGDRGFGATPDDRQFYRLPLIRTLWQSGRCMVCTFFVISGYVLTQNTLKKLQRRDFEGAFSSISSAIFRRGIRLFPPALVSCCIGFVLVRLGFRGSKDDPYLPYFSSFLDQLWHFMVESIRFLDIFYLAPRTFGGDLMHKYEAVVWSIPMEFVGSMAIYLVVLGTAHLERRLRNLIILGIALYGLASGCWTIFCFYCGILLADFDLERPRHSDKLPSMIQTALWSCVLTLGLWMAGAPQRGPPEQDDFALGFNLQWYLTPERFLKLDVNYTGWSIAAAMICLASSQLSYVKSFLELPSCQYLGKVSFSLYLNHVWIRDVGGRWLQHNIAGVLGDSHVAVVFTACIWYSILVMINLLIATIFERYIDAPVVRFAKHLNALCVARAVAAPECVASYLVPDEERNPTQLEAPYELHNLTLRASEEALLEFTEK